MYCYVQLWGNTHFKCQLLTAFYTQIFGVLKVGVNAGIWFFEMDPAAKITISAYSFKLGVVKQSGL